MDQAIWAGIISIIVLLCALSLVSSVLRRALGIQKNIAIWTIKKIFGVFKRGLRRWR